MKKKQVHMLSSESSCWDVVNAIESLAKQQGGFSWKPVTTSPPIVVPDRIKAMFERIDLEPMADLIAKKQSDWKLVVPALQKLVPPGLSRDDASMLLDMLLVTYACNMGVGIPYVAVG